MQLAVGFEEITRIWNRRIPGGDASGHAIDCMMSYASICDRTFIPIVFVNVVKMYFNSGLRCPKINSLGLYERFAHTTDSGS